MGIFWDAKNDVIKFKIDLKDQPVTRQSMLSVNSSIYDPLELTCHFSCKEEGFFKVCVKSSIVGIKWFLTTSVKNGKHGKTV